eukprot:GILK01009495.1.p1 GENE.GILK01009495.1~~GILK01009495.1.p1  ORF type:complete len:357 (+),score=37.46 GILK01009495.1:43-1071(+)
MDKVEGRNVALALSAVAGFAVAAWYQFSKLQRGRAALLEVTELNAALQHEREKRQHERLGRIKAEKELRQRAHGAALKDGFSFLPIGLMESCFKDRRGTPRQGLLASKVRGRLRIRANLNPAASLDGLSGFSHVWVIFVFHENTNVVKGMSEAPGKSPVKAKVEPPRMGGMRIGLFATRTPHRPNPIGLSLARLDKVEGDTLWLSGIDLVDGTPVLDIKPYTPYDCNTDAAMPPWLALSTDAPNFPVEFTMAAIEQLQAHVPVLTLYDNVDDIRDAIVEVLSMDIRSIHQKNKSDASTVFEFRLDNLMIKFVYESDRLLVTHVNQNIMRPLSPVEASDNGDL